MGSLLKKSTDSDNSKGDINKTTSSLRAEKAIDSITESFFRFRFFFMLSISSLNNGCFNVNTCSNEQDGSIRPYSDQNFCVQHQTHSDRPQITPPLPGPLLLPCWLLSRPPHIPTSPPPQSCYKLSHTLRTSFQKPR